MRSAGTIILFISLMLSAPACLQEPDGTAFGEGAVDGPPVKRSLTVLTADRYARAHWTMTEENRTGVTCGGTFVSNYPVGDRVGVGYKWGGWTELDEYLDKVSRGWGTGTGGGLTWDTIPFDCVVGVSCTGLVSRAWHLDNKYTLNYDDPDIPRKFEEITHVVEGVDFASRKVSGLRKGDVFINRYHVMLFVYETIYGVPMIIDSSYEGVRFRPVSWYDLASDRYTAIRYNNIVEPIDPPGTVSNPIRFQAGTHEISLEGNTRDVVSIEFHSYSIEPSVRQPGPEVVYEVVVKDEGIIEASITQFKHEGIDNDIHLLGSLGVDDNGMALDCLARGDYLIEYGVGEGRWYLVIDSRNNSPGEYTMTVRFRPADTLYR